MEKYKYLFSKNHAGLMLVFCEHIDKTDNCRASLKGSQTLLL